MAIPSGPQAHTAALTQALRASLAPAATLAMQARAGVLVALFDLPQWHRFQGAAAGVLDAAESARAARQRRPEIRDARVLAYALHRLLLAEVLGCGPAAVPLTRDDKGCPRLRGDRVFTSLSHADDRVAIAVSGLGPVGIDVESTDHASGMPELAERVAHPDELRALAGLDADAFGHALLEMWVRKEALLKAAGIGLECEMDGFVAPWGRAVPLPGGPFQGRLAQLLPLRGPRWAGAVALPPGAALTFAGPSAPP